MRHILRLAYTLTFDERYVAQQPDTLVLVRRRLALFMVAAKCLLTNVDLGVKLEQMARGNQQDHGLDVNEQSECCQVIVEVIQDYVARGNSAEVNHVSESIAQDLQQWFHELGCML